LARITRDQFFAAAIPTEVVEVPELGGSVEIRALTVAQQQTIATSVKRMKDGQDADAACKTLIEGMIDPQLTAADYDALKERSAGAITRIVGRIVCLSGMTKESQDEIMGKS
jgi:hypothetical protein